MSITNSTHTWTTQLVTDRHGRTSCAIRFTRIDERGDPYAALVVPSRTLDRGGGPHWPDQRAMGDALRTLKALGDPPLVPIGELGEHTGSHPVVLGSEWGPDGSVSRVVVSRDQGGAFELHPLQPWSAQTLGSLVGVLKGERGRPAAAG